MLDLIVLGGAPGTGKTTIAKLLQKKLKGPYIDFGWMREWHLDPKWTQASEKEEHMAFENLVFMLRNYIQHGFKNIVLTDLQDFRIQQLPRLFSKHKILIITLVITDNIVLQKRVISPKRDSGFHNAPKALAWNKAVLKRHSVKNEIKFDNTNLTPLKAAKEILKLITTH